VLFYRGRAVDRCPGDVHRTAGDETRLDLLPLQRGPEDVRSTLGAPSSCGRQRPTDRRTEDQQLMAVYTGSIRHTASSRASTSQSCPGSSCSLPVCESARRCDDAEAFRSDFETRRRRELRSTTTSPRSPRRRQAAGSLTTPAAVEL